MPSRARPDEPADDPSPAPEERLWIPPRRPISVPNALPVPFSPKDLYKKNLVQLARLDLHLDPSLAPQHRRLLAALLVEHVYAWNAVRDWRLARNLIADVIRGANSSVSRQTPLDARKKLVGLLRQLAEHPQVGSPDRQREARELADALEQGRPDLPEAISRFTLTLRCHAWYCFGALSQVGYEIPGVGWRNFDIGFSPQCNTAARMLAYLLLQLLTALYGTKRHVDIDAYAITDEVFEHALETAPEFEAIRARRWRSQRAFGALLEEPGRTDFLLDFAELADLLEGGV